MSAHDDQNTVTFKQAKAAALELGLDNAKGLYKTKTPAEPGQLSGNDYAIAFDTDYPNSPRALEAVNHLLQHVEHNHGHMAGFVQDAGLTQAHDTLARYRDQLAKTVENATKLAGERGGAARSA